MRTLILLLGFALSACTAAPQVAYDNPGPCPDGREWTSWCGCEAPLHGDDC